MTLLEEVTSPDLKRLVQAGVTTAVIPFGSVEYQGRHLPLGADALLADAVGHAVAASGSGAHRCCKRGSSVRSARSERRDRRGESRTLRVQHPAAGPTGGIGPEPVTSCL